MQHIIEEKRFCQFWDRYSVPGSVQHAISLRVGLATPTAVRYIAMQLEHFLHGGVLLRARSCVHYLEFGGCPIFRCCYSINTYNYQSARRGTILLTAWKWTMHPEVTFTLWEFCTGGFQHGGQDSWWTEVDATSKRCRCDGFLTRAAVGKTVL